MAKIRNIQISDRQDQQIQQGESLFKWLIPLFLLVAWFTQSPAPEEVHYWRVAAVGNKPEPFKERSACDRAVVLCVFGEPIL